MLDAAFFSQKSFKPKFGYHVTRGCEVWIRNAQFANENTPPLTRKVSIAATLARERLAESKSSEKNPKTKCILNFLLVLFEANLKQKLFLFCSPIHLPTGS